MRDGIHPDDRPAVFEDVSTGDRFLTRSTTGRVERFTRRHGDRAVRR